MCGEMHAGGQCCMRGEVHMCRNLTLGPVVLRYLGESHGTSGTWGSPLAQRGLGPRISRDFPQVWVSRDFARWVTSLNNKKIFRPVPHI